MLGVKVADVIALKPYLTVANPAGTIDLWDASRRFSPPCPASRRPRSPASEAARQRTDKIKDQLMTLVGEAQALVTTEPTVAYRVSLDVLSNRGARRKASAVIARDGTQRAAIA